MRHRPHLWNPHAGLSFLGVFQLVSGDVCLFQTSWEAMNPSFLHWCVNKIAARQECWVFVPQHHKKSRPICPLGPGAYGVLVDFTMLTWLSNVQLEIFFYGIPPFNSHCWGVTCSHQCNYNHLFDAGLFSLNPFLCKLYLLISCAVDFLDSWRKFCNVLDPLLFMKSTFFINVFRF